MRNIEWPVWPDAGNGGVPVCVIRNSALVRVQPAAVRSAADSHRRNPQDREGTHALRTLGYLVQ